MTRTAVHTGFERFVDDVVDTAYREFDIVGAVRRGAGGSGSRVVSKLAKQSDLLDRRVARPELQRHRDTVLDQFEYVIEYAATDDDFEAYADDIVATDMYLDALRDGLSTEQRSTLRSELLERQRRLGDAIVPLVESSMDEFWAAVHDAFDRPEARTFVDEHFAFTEPVLDHRDAFQFVTTIDPGELLAGPFSRALPSLDVDYTNEAIRTMRRAERDVISTTLEEIDDRYE